jgi:hypothetical protein
LLLDLSSPFDFHPGQYFFRQGHTLVICSLSALTAANYRSLAPLGMTILK